MNFPFVLHYSYQPFVDCMYFNFENTAKTTYETLRAAGYDPRLFRLREVKDGIPIYDIISHQWDRKKGLIEIYGNN